MANLSKSLLLLIIGFSWDLTLVSAYHGSKNWPWILGSDVLMKQQFHTRGKGKAEKGTTAS